MLILELLSCENRPMRTVFLRDEPLYTSHDSNEVCCQTL